MVLLLSIILVVVVVAAAAVAAPAASAAAAAVIKTGNRPTDLSFAIRMGEGGRANFAIYDCLVSF